MTAISSQSSAGSGAGGNTGCTAQSRRYSRTMSCALGATGPRGGRRNTQRGEGDAGLQYVLERALRARKRRSGYKGAACCGIKHAQRSIRGRRPLHPQAKLHASQRLILAVVEIDAQEQAATACAVIHLTDGRSVAVHGAGTPVQPVSACAQPFAIRRNPPIGFGLETSGRLEARLAMEL